VRIVGIAGLADAVVHFIDVGDAILPNAGLPLRAWQRIGEDAAVTVKRGKLAGFLIDRHAT
jgi:hypothetical protein